LFQVTRTQFWSECTTSIRQFWWQLLFSSCDWTKTMEREKRRERIKTHVSMRERVGSKVVKKWLYKYDFSIGIYLERSIFMLEKWYLYNHFLTTFETTLSLILTCVFILSLLSLSIVFVQSQEEKSSCHQSYLILVVQISPLFMLWVVYSIVQSTPSVT